MERRTAPRRLASALLGLAVCCSTLPAFAVSIKVLNGSRTAGRAAQVGSFLKKNGYPVSKVDKADKTFDSTVVYFKDGAHDDAKKIADLMPGTQSIKPLSWESQFDLIIVVGSDHPAQAEPSAEPSQESRSPQPTAPAASEGSAPSESPSGEVTSTPPASSEPEVPEVEGEGESAVPPAEEQAPVATEPAPPAESKPAEPAKPKAVKPKPSKPATKSAPAQKPASKVAGKPSAPEAKPAPSGYAEIGVSDLMKQVADHIGKNVRVQDDFMDQSNYFLGMKDHGIGPEEYVEFFSGDSRVNLIIYVPKSNRDALATLNAFKRGDKVIIHGKVFAKNPIGRPLLMADRLDRG